RGHMHLRHILELNHIHQRHPRAHNMKTEEDMKTVEDEGIVKAIRCLSTPTEVDALSSIVTRALVERGSERRLLPARPGSVVSQPHLRQTCPAPHTKHLRA